MVVTTADHVVSLQGMIRQLILIALALASYSELASAQPGFTDISASWGGGLLDVPVDSVGIGLIVCHNHTDKWLALEATISGPDAEMFSIDSEKRSIAPSRQWAPTYDTFIVRFQSHDTGVFRASIAITDGAYSTGVSLTAHAHPLQFASISSNSCRPLLSIFPNPTNGLFTLLVNGNKTEDYYLENTFGEKLDIREELPSGVYFLFVKSHDENIGATSRLIIRR
jgi:hypothetical protein